jgi:hypothetical protein
MIKSLVCLKKIKRAIWYKKIGFFFDSQANQPIFAATIVVTIHNSKSNNIIWHKT